MSETYPNGEVISKDRIEDEDWYPDYQAMMEMAMFQTSGKRIYRLYVKDFTEVFRREITVDECVKFQRWADFLAEGSKEFLDSDWAKNDKDLWKAIALDVVSSLKDWLYFKRKMWNERVQTSSQKIR